MVLFGQNPSERKWGTFLTQKCHAQDDSASLIGQEAQKDLCFFQAWLSIMSWQLAKNTEKLGDSDSPFHPKQWISNMNSFQDSPRVGPVEVFFLGNQISTRWGPYTTYRVTSFQPNFWGEFLPLKKPVDLFSANFCWGFSAHSSIFGKRSKKGPYRGGYLTHPSRKFQGGSQGSSRIHPFQSHFLKFPFGWYDQKESDSTSWYIWYSWY